MVVFVTGGDIYDENSTYFMLLDDARETWKRGDDYYWKYEKAYVNGEKTTLLVDYDAVEKLAKADPNSVSENGRLKDDGTLYKATKTVEDGKYITELEAVKLTNLPVNAVGDDAFWLTVNPTKTVKYDTDEDTVFVLVEMKNGKNNEIDAISDGDINDMFEYTEKGDDDGFNTFVTVVKDANDHNTARLVYIISTNKAIEAPKAGDRTVTVTGEAKADKKTVTEDKADTITLTPNPGYAITKVTGGNGVEMKANGTVVVDIAAGKGEIKLAVTTEKVEYTVTATGLTATTGTIPTSAKIGDALSFTLTAAEAGVNTKVVKANGVKIGEFKGGAAAVPATYELIQVVSSEADFTAVKTAAGTVYDKDGKPIDSYTSGSVALYKVKTEAVDAVAATAVIDTEVTAAMLEGKTAIAITVE